MGHRLEFYLPQEVASDVIAISQSFGIEAQVIGHVEDAATNSLTIQSPYGTLRY